jgi:PAS domain S-box-containing protein
MQDLVDGSPTPICLTDEDGRFVLVNSEFERLVGAGRALLIDRTPAWDLIGELAVSLGQRDRDCLRSGLVVDAEEEVVRDGQSATYLSVRYPLALPGGLRGVAAIYTNISGQKRTEHALREAQAILHRQAEQLSTANTELKEVDELRTQFIATVSHELRTPLTSILSYAEILATEEALAPVTQRMIAVISRNGRQLLGLIEDLLMFAQIDAGRLEFEPTVTNVADIVDHCCVEILPAIRTAGLTIESDIQPGLSPVTVESRRLERVLLNLLSNAIKFSSDGGRVTVTCRQDAPSTSVSIAVRDLGIGIPGDEQRHVGNRFFRSSISRQRAIGGTGLGLAICKEIVAGYGGHVTVDSAVGAGTTVTVTLPTACGQDSPDRSVLLARNRSR